MENPDQILHADETGSGNVRESRGENGLEGRSFTLDSPASSVVDEGASREADREEADVSPSDLVATEAETDQQTDQNSSEQLGFDGQMGSEQLDAESEPRSLPEWAETIQNFVNDQLVSFEQKQQQFQQQQQTQMQELLASVSQLATGGHQNQSQSPLQLLKSTHRAPCGWW